MMACWFPACLCGGQRFIADAPAAQGHRCCHKHDGRPEDGGKQRHRRCDCDQTPALTGKGASLGTHTFDLAALPPPVAEWTSPVAGQALPRSVVPVKLVACRPASSLLRQHCALVV